MKNDLLQTVASGLAKLKGEWPQIAADLAPNVSYSFISKVGRRQYESDPSYRKLQLIAEYLRKRAA